MFLGDKLMKTSVFTPLVLVVCAFALAACANTVRGVGKDVKDTGRAVQQTIE
jgi:predicted small secreted protein